METDIVFYKQETDIEKCKQEITKFFKDSFKEINSKKIIPNGTQLLRQSELMRCLDR